MSFLRLPTIGKYKKRQYDVNLIRKAYDHVKMEKMSVCKAAKLYGIPVSTLRDRTLGIQPVPDSKGRPTNPGPSPLFSMEEEEQLVEHVTYMAGIGYGYSRKEFINLATDFAIKLKKRTPSEPVLAQSWFDGFKKRNPDLTLGKAQKLSMVRAKSTSPSVLENYFNELESVYEKHDFWGRPENIWNMDETGLMMEHTPTKIICQKGTTPQAITSNRGKNVTIIAMGSAAGMCVPPFYVFPGKRWNADLLQGASPGSSGTVTESGWSNSTVMLEYLEQHFLKFVSTNGKPILILFDGHKSHVNLTLTDWGKAHNVIFFVLPPHTSHITQPLDVGCFGPLKNCYYSECQAFLRRNPGIHITRNNIAMISGKAYNKGLTPENLISAFRKTGIYPCDRTKIDGLQTAPSAIYSDLNNDLDVNKGNDNSHSPVSFLDSRKITKAVEVTKKRKQPPSVNGNLMSPSKAEKMKHLEPEPTKKSKLSIKQTLAPNVKPQNSKEPMKKKATENLTRSTLPVTKPVKQLSPRPGPSAINLMYEDSDNLSLESEASESDKCCMCKKMTPDALNLAYVLEIVHWGQCDICQHWTHLKFCTPVRVLRRGSTFRCPHCEIN